MTAHTKKITTFTAAMGGQKEVASQDVLGRGTMRLDSIIGPDYHRQLMDDIELLDGACDELDHGACQPRKFIPGILWFGADKLWCRDIPGAFPENDNLAAAEKYDNRHGGSVLSEISARLSSRFRQI